MKKAWCIAIGSLLAGSPLAVITLAMAIIYGWGFVLSIWAGVVVLFACVLFGVYLLSKGFSKED